MNRDDVDTTSSSLDRITTEGPQVNADFKQAHCGGERERPEPQFGSEQVEKDASRLNYPAPSWGGSVDSEAHWNAAGKDAARAEAQHRQAEKQAFLDRQKELRAQQPDEPNQDRGVERD